MKVTLRKALQDGTKLLENHHIRDAKIDAMLLLEFILKVTKVEVLVHGNKEICSQAYKEYMYNIDLRAQRKPLQYLTREQEFMGLTFTVNNKVLIPRQDTEILVEKAIELIQLHPIDSVMDIGTGSGCIAVSLCHFCDDVEQVVALDVSHEALDVARYNAKHLHVEDRIIFIQSDLFESLDSKYSSSVDLIISNPPYIPTAHIKNLMTEVREYEPFQALNGGEDGLDYYKRIAKTCKPLFKTKGYLLFEIGYNQKEEVRKLLIAEGYQNIEGIKDCSGLDRVVLGYYQAE